MASPRPSVDQNPTSLGTLQAKIWHGTLPLAIHLAASECRTYDQSDPYLVNIPRLSYLPLLLPRLHAFFGPSLINPSAAAPHHGWFSFEGVPLRWHYPAGLLYDLFSGADPSSPHPKHDPGNDTCDSEGEQQLPWRLELHFEGWPDEQLVRLDAEGRVLHDAFINSVKEADFLRNGTAKGIMSLSKDDSTQLWDAVQSNNLRSFNTINNKLLDPPGAPLRHIPLKIYLPSSAPASTTSTTPPPPTHHLSQLAEEPTSSSPTQDDAPPASKPQPQPEPQQASLRVLQSPVTPSIGPSAAGTAAAAIGGPKPTSSSSSPDPSSTSSHHQQQTPQTLGTTLHALLPSLFPSRRTPILARAVLHGAVVPLAAPVEELMRTAAYADGWLHLGVVMMA
ncbi:MAG: hypothetical protein M1819_006309 [Sarea resinae]|nr:MAG: hypothetical protein M1819_006309 [Sarea resinae]